MRKYAIKKDKEDKVLSILLYDENTKTFTIDIPEDVTEKEAPLIMASFVKRGVRHVDQEWSMRWVRSRITPNSRQNIGQILRENRMKAYDEFAFLIKSQGRCCQDECYIEEM